MAGPERIAPLVVAALEQLDREPYNFDFFQALRLIECAHPDLPRLGQALRAAEEAVRLSQVAEVTFAPSAIASSERIEAGRRRLSVYFMGLFGPHGPLPIHLTEYARDRLRNSSDPTLVRFLDIFHHRMLTLFYRAAANARPTISADRPDEDRIGDHVAALIGLGLPALRNRDEFSDWSKQSYACHLVRHARNLGGLLDMLTDYLGLPVEIEEFVGHWIDLPQDGLLNLGTSAEMGVLGQSFTIGARVWDCQYKFRVSIGPLGIADFRRLLPGGITLRRVVAAIRNYVGDEFLWDVRLVLKREEVPTMTLGKQGELGWTMWLNSQPPPDHRGDLTLDPMQHSRRIA